MSTYKQVSDVIEKNTRAIVLFTHGPHFHFNDAGNGQTGKWHVNPDVVEKVDKVIIYLRRDGGTDNKIFLGKYAGIEKSDLPRRYTIRFSALKEVGTTESNWLEFAKSGQNPVSYVRV